MEPLWTISYSYDKEFIYAFLPNATINLSAISKIDLFYGIKSTIAEYKRYASDLYQNHGQNFMFNIILQAIRKYKEFFSAIAEKFVKTFKVQTIKIVEIVKVPKKKKIYKKKLVDMTSQLKKLYASNILFFI